MTTENTEIELSEQDRADLAALGVPEGETPEFHPIIEIWREVLKPAADEAKKDPTPQWCSRIVAAYHGVGYADMLDFRDRYFGHFLELLSMVEAEIASDPDCLLPRAPEDDVEQNSYHYKNLLMVWQQAFLQWELDWDCQDPAAAVELAAISEVHKAIFGQTGVTAFLDNIRFEYTEADQADLAAVLAEQRGVSGE